MKKLCTLLAFIPCFLFAAETDPLSFFPHKVGNTWFYRWEDYPGHLFPEIGIERIEKDSTDSAGNHYIKLYAVEYKIQPNGDVYSLYPKHTGLEYKFTAKTGEQWRKNPDDEFPNNHVIGHLEKRYTEFVYGEVREIVDIVICQLGDINFPEDGCIGNGRLYTFVSGIGLVFEQDVETGNRNLIFEGAIINGDTIGNIPFISVIDDFPSSTNEKAFPNPATDILNIPFTLQTDEQVEISLYNTLGEKFAVILNEAKAAGQHIAHYSTHTIPSGFYICEITTGKHRIRQSISVHK